MATSNCLFTTYCVQNTGFPEWDDTYVRTGTFNDNSYYIGQTNGYVIFFSSEGYWCLADYIDGTCFLSGKKPCYTICPDFCDDYFTRGICPPPSPDPVQACATFDFDAYFECDVPIPTPQPTPQCGDIITTSATSPTSVINLVSNPLTVYTNQGTIFHSPFNFDGTSPGNIYLAVSTTDAVWKRRSSFLDGPLNRSGLWAANPFPIDTWMGFSVCVNAPETKTYWIGLGADNDFRISIDGTTIVNTIGGVYDGNTFAFTFWHVYPVTLTSGNHTVELYGLNRLIGSQAVFGCEIYDNTIEELTGATQVSDLNIIFTSSGQLSATTVQNISGEYQSSGFTCPSGYTFDPCTISCFSFIPPCTPTATPTPTATVFCPLTVNASIQSFTPTPTSTPAITPSSTGTINRGCGFMGDVTFNTINTTILCSFSLEFQDCYNGSRYYTTNTLSNPGGGALEQFMIFQATIDGKRACISYVGVNNDIIGGNNIVFVSGLIGYSNLGQCASCLEVLTPTPTPTPSITPTITLTSTSNKPAPPAASNTPTPTKTRPVVYYTYERCGTNRRVCQPFEAYIGQSIGTYFKTGSVGEYPNTCWLLVSITSSCNTSNPNYTTITYSTNAFPSVLNNLYSSCSNCLTNTTAPPEPPKLSPTPTPSKTSAPKVEPVSECKPHVVYLGPQRCSVCNNNTPQLTIYSPNATLVVGARVYTNPTCTFPVAPQTFVKSVIPGSATFVVGGGGVLINNTCEYC